MKVRNGFTVIGVVIAGLSLVIGQSVAVDHTDPVALPELGVDTYLEEQGGLYPNGLNEPPAAYQAEIDAAYAALSADSDIQFLCIGMSNLKHTCDAMIEDVDAQMSPNVTIGNGGRPGFAIQYWDSGVNDLYTSLNRAGMNPNNVDVVIFFNACRYPATSYCGDWVEMQDSFESVYDSINTAYSNVKLIYFTSREYAPPEAVDLNPNPYAYQDGFSVKWAIESRINGSLSGAPVMWGPYQYDESWPLSYFRDGDWVHLSDEGLEVAGALWYDFFLTQPWFSTGPVPTSTPQPPTATPDPNITPTNTPLPTDTPTITPTAGTCEERTLECFCFNHPGANICQQGSSTE